MSRPPRRGDVFWVNLDPVVGRALGDQIRSIDKHRLKARVSTLTADEMARIDEALAITLGLPL